MAQLAITQVRSTIGGTSQQRNTVRSLGLKRIGDTVVQDDRPEIRGMIAAVSHLVSYEVTDGDASAATATTTTTGEK